MVGIMGWSQSLQQELWGGARGYGVRARDYGVGARGYGSLVILVTASVRVLCDFWGLKTYFGLRTLACQQDKVLISFEFMSLITMLL